MSSQTLPNEPITEVPPISPPARVVTAEVGGQARRVTVMQPSRIIYCYPDQSELVYELQQPRAIPPRSPAASDEEEAGHPDADTYSDKKSHHSSTHHHQNNNRNNSDSGSNAAAAVAGVTNTLAIANTNACLCGCVGGYMQPERVRDITPENPRIGTPGPVTLFAFGLTTCLYNVHQAGICPLNMTTMGLICFYGGLAQFVGGFFELINKNTIFCTLDVTYGSFWMATAIGSLVPANDNVVGTATEDYMGGFFMLWFFFAATMFVCALHSFTYVQILLNFSVALNFLLNFIGHFARSPTLLKVAGYEGTVEGALATYVGMAFSIRDIYGFDILPLFFRESKGFKVTEW